jgi:hypothetical protein
MFIIFLVYYSYLSIYIYIFITDYVVVLVMIVRVFWELFALVHLYLGRLWLLFVPLLFKGIET